MNLRQQFCFYPYEGPFLPDLPISRADRTDPDSGLAELVDEIAADGQLLRVDVLNARLARFRQQQARVLDVERRSLKIFASGAEIEALAKIASAEGFEQVDRRRVGPNCEVLCLLFRGRTLAERLQLLTVCTIPNYDGLN